MWKSYDDSCRKLVADSKTGDRKIVGSVAEWQARGADRFGILVEDKRCCAGISPAEETMGLLLVADNYKRVKMVVTTIAVESLRVN